MFFKGPFGGAYQFLEGFMFAGAYLGKEICLSKSIEPLVSLIIGSKFPVFALFYFVFVIEGNFPSTSPRGLMFGGAI